MKKTPLLLIFIFPLALCAQPDRQKTFTDSSAYYKKELSELWRNLVDSVRNSEHYHVLVEKIKNAHPRWDHYSGAVLYGDIVHSNFTRFNNSIVRNGFSPLQAMSFRLGFGISTKTNRMLFDFYAATIGFNNKSTKGDQKIRSSLSNLLQFDLGYDLLKSKIISLYPFAGLSLRSSSLNFSSPAQVNSNYSDITNIVSNDASVNASSLRVGYQAGIGLDLALVKWKNNQGRTIFFTKFGTNGPIGADRYNIHGIKYAPGIRQGDWLFTIGIKFASYK